MRCAWWSRSSCWVQITEAVILHEGSTLVVVANGLRLLAWRAPAMNV